MRDVDHLSEGVLQAILDGETPHDESVRRHLRSCERCASVQEALRLDAVTLSAAVKELDRPLRGVEEALARVRDRRTRRRWRGTSHLARAAILVVALSGALSAAVPGSPVRDWLESVWSELTFESRLPEITPERPAVRGEGTGVWVESGPELTITVSGAGEGTEVSVELVRGSRAGAFTDGEARYRSGPGFIEVLNPAGDVRVELARGAARTSLLVNGRVYLRGPGSAPEVMVTPVERTEGWILFRVVGNDVR